METLGAQIRSARIDLGYTQTDLADLMGVGQQAASRWERDGSVPDEPTLERLRALLHAPLTVEPKPTPLRPVMLRRLPLKHLDRSQFLSLAKTLLGIVYSGAEIRSFKQAGSGIDFQVSSSHGDRIGVRCATTWKFHPASFDKAVRAVAPVANEYLLLLNVQATAKVRERAAAVESWALWDANDISDLLMDCPASTLDAIMDLYFPDLRVVRTPGRAPGIFVKPLDDRTY